MKTLIGLCFLVVGLTAVSSDSYAAGNKGKGGAPAPSPNPAALKQQQQQQQQLLNAQKAAQQKAAQAAAQQTVANNKGPKPGYPGVAGPVGQRPNSSPPRQPGQWDCRNPGTGPKTPMPAPCSPKTQPVCNNPKMGNPKMGNGNWAGNGNWNGNKNGNNNTNGNANNLKNNNRINNSNDVNVNVGGFGSGGFGEGYGYGYGNGFPGNGNSYNYTAPGYSYSPTGGTWAPTYAFNPTYDFSGWGNMAQPYGAFAAPVGLPPVPNAVAFNEDDPDTAWITLELPDEDAEVWLNGAKQTIKGPLRKYVTPPLQKDKLYNYEIKVQWPLEKGRKLGAKINYSTTISFKAGDEITHTVPPEGDGKAGAPPPPKLEAQPQDEAKLMNQRLNWAKDLLKEGKTDAAKNRLKDIVNKSPDSPAGQEAKAILDKMQ